MLTLIFSSILVFLLGFCLLFSFVVCTFFLIAAILSFFAKKEGGILLPDAKLPFISIHIPTRNELVALDCAKLCIQSSYPSKKMEIIIGDDSNKKEISEKIKQFVVLQKKSFEGTIKITTRLTNAGFKSGNLNNILKHTSPKAEIIVIFDSDSRTEKDFLKKLISPLVFDSEISAVQSRSLYYNENDNLFTFFSNTNNRFFQTTLGNFANFLGLGMLCGWGEAIRKKALVEMGGWDENVLNEDTSATIKLCLQGKKIKFLYNLECKGDTPSNFLEFLKQQKRWAFGIALSYKLNLKNYFQSISKNFLPIFFQNVFSSIFKNSNKNNASTKITKISPKFFLASLLYSLNYLNVFFAALIVFLSAIYFFISSNPNGIFNFFGTNLPQTLFPWVGEILKMGLVQNIFLISMILGLISDGSLIRIPLYFLCLVFLGPFVMVYIIFGILQALFGVKLNWFITTKKFENSVNLTNKS